MLLYIVLSILCIAFDFFVAVRSFAHKSPVGQCTGVTCLMAGVVNLTYAAGVFAKSELLFSVLNSMYFCSIDIMLAYFYSAALYHTGFNHSKGYKRIQIVMLLWMLVDMLVLITNPIHHWAVDYVVRSESFPIYKYDLHFIYNFHLAITYICVLLILYLLYSKAKSIPGNYRRQYYYVVAGVIAVVLINCGFLFVHGDSLATEIDWSLFGYSVAAFTVYWSFFEYSERGMQREFKNYMFDHIDTGMVMFDYNGNNLLINKCAANLLPQEALAQGMKEEDFTRICGIPISHSSYNLQVYMNQRTLRCDMEVMLDKDQRGIGRMYSFKDTQTDTDLLTGYWAWDSFLRFERIAVQARLYPAVCVIFDLNALQRYNQLNGRSEGDMLLRDLSEHIKTGMPVDAYFVRGREAQLIVMCPGLSEDEIRLRADKIRADFKAPLEYSMSCANGTRLRFNEAVLAAEMGLRVKKLLDTNTGHSDNLAVLIQALQQCDPDTEEHVRRTRYSGDMLGRRLKLSDVQLSDLSLLCLLHDIGKIAIPLDILNKPGKLSLSEWDVMKTHVQKGYQIGISNNATCSIAEMILHHHEKWDGTGYPDGLKGEEIPLLSRIISVVDAYDAMTNERAYRKAMSAESAFKELERCSGTQFDPHIVSEFIEMQREQMEPGQNIPSSEKNDNRNDAVTDNIPDKEVSDVKYARFMFDENHRITEAFEGFEDFTGYTAEYVKHNCISLFDLLPQEDLAEYKNHIKRELLDNAMLYLEHRLRRRDGSITRVLCFGKWRYDSSLRARRCEVVMTETVQPINNTYSIHT